MDLWMNTYMYVCMYVCTYVCIFVCMYVHMYVGMYFCMYVYMYIHMYVCMYVHIYVCIYICMYMCMYVCMYKCMIIFSNHVSYSTIKWTVFAAWVLCTFFHEADKIWSFHRNVIMEFFVYLLAACACYVCCEFYPNISVSFGGRAFCII